MSDCARGEGDDGSNPAYAGPTRHMQYWRPDPMTAGDLEIIDVTPRLS